MSVCRARRSFTVGGASLALLLLGVLPVQAEEAGTRWGPAERVSAQAERAGPYRGGPREVVRTGAHGRAVAAWMHGDPARLYASVRRPERGWSRRTALSSSGVDISYESFDAAIGPHGVVSVVWSEPGSHARRVLLESHRKDGRWTAPSVISARTRRSADVAVDGDGVTVVAWAGDGGLRVARRPATGSWTRPEQVAKRPRAQPVLEVSHAGDAVVAWGARSGGRPLVRAAVQRAGGGWSPPRTLVKGRHAYLSDVAIGPHGEALVMWTTYECCYRSGVGWVRRTATGAWTAPAYLSRELGEGVGGGVTLSMNRKGQAVATWKQVPGGSGGDAEPVEVVASVFRRDHTWTPVQRLLEPAGYLQCRQEAWMDGAGGAHVVVGRGRRIWSFDRLPTGVWSRDLVGEGYLTAADGHGGVATVLYLRVDEPHGHRARTGRARAG